MSIRSKVVTAVAMLAVVAGVGVAGTQPANAETRNCDTQCVELSSAAFGAGHILDVVNDSDAVGASVTLAAASPANRGEDFSVDFNAISPPLTVDDYIQAGLISPGMGPRWGKLYAFEIQYTPYGAQNGTCVGLANPGIFATVTMQPCGLTARTFWIYDPLGTAANSPAALISAATSGNFNNPLTLTALLLLPGMPLITADLATPPLASQRAPG